MCTDGLAANGEFFLAQRRGELRVEELELARAEEGIGTGRVRRMRPGHDVMGAVKTDQALDSLWVAPYCFTA